MNISNYPTLEYFLFVAVNLTKNADVNKHKYLDMELDLRGMGVFHLLVLD